MTLIAERPHIKYGSAIFIRNYLKVKCVTVWVQDNVELISIEMPGVVVLFVYKKQKFLVVGPTTPPIMVEGSNIRFYAHTANGCVFMLVQLNKCVVVWF